MNQENLENNESKDIVSKEVNDSLSTNIINKFLGIFEKVIDRKVDSFVLKKPSVDDDVSPVAFVDKPVDSLKTNENIDVPNVNVPKLDVPKLDDTSSLTPEYPSPMPINGKVKESALDKFQEIYKRNPRQASAYFVKHSGEILRGFTFI